MLLLLLFILNGTRFVLFNEFSRNAVLMFVNVCVVPFVFIRHPFVPPPPPIRFDGDDEDDGVNIIPLTLSTTDSNVVVDG